MRLQKYLASCGVASRRKAEKLIAAGRVRVGGLTVFDPATQVTKEDEVTFDGKQVTPEKHVYILLNKPKGVVSTSSDEHASKKVLDLVKTDKRLYAVGRLDKDTEGLLILTNDGDLTYRLTHPKFHIAKTYLARVKGHISRAALEQLMKGVAINLGDMNEDANWYTTKPAKAAVMKEKRGSTLLRITISEGKKRQVRKMCAAVGHPIVSLRRVAIGSLTDDTLKAGQWRPLTAEEVARLRNEVCSD